MRCSIIQEYYLYREKSFAGEKSLHGLRWREIHFSGILSLIPKGKSDQRELTNHLL